MKYTLENGMVLEGTAEQVSSVLKALGKPVNDGHNYLSAKNGLMKISDMNTEHLKNASAKILVERIQTAKTLAPKEYAAAVTSLPENNKTLLGLLFELTKRTA